ncbi:hypothetical protein CYMTET_40530 [Cymbomonas tetramitiformis]|uniref:Uncharacterized protein n=1 Tax=Cymbomonas tetramitiformis TaxID=36881 RepID=A0AAE0C7U6_9CHLO|nr:hypothetical protein CYMTET_40530 [Cymbomonas tetramitiformis]
MAASAAKSCYVAPLYLVVLRSLRAGKAASSTSAGAAAYSFNGTKSNCQERRVEPVGEWRAEGGMFKTWFGTGSPCVTEAYADGTAPDFAAAASVPPTWTKQPVPRLAAAAKQPPAAEDAAVMMLQLPAPPRGSAVGGPALS